MKSWLLLFWTLLIFGSIAWYGFLLFYVGAKGGREILHLTRQLGRRKPPGPDPTTRAHREEGGVSR
jgi:hypothetical protein